MRRADAGLARLMRMFSRTEPRRLGAYDEAVTLWHAILDILNDG